MRDHSSYKGALFVKASHLEGQVSSPVDLAGGPGYNSGLSDRQLRQTTRKK